MKFHRKSKKSSFKMSYRMRITISLVIIALLMTSYMGISSFLLSNNVILDLSKQLSENNFNVVYKSLDNYFLNAEKNSTQLIRMPALQTTLQYKPLDSIQYDKATSELNTSVRAILNLASSNDRITFNVINIYCKNGYNYNYFDNYSFPFKDYESCIKYYTDNHYIVDGYKPSTWSNIIKIADVTGRQIYSFINLRILYDPANYEEIGVLITGINVENLYDIYETLSNEAYIIHKYGDIISHPDKSMIGTSIQEDPLFKRMTESTKTMDTFTINNGNKRQLVTFKKLALNDVYFVVPFDYFSGNEILEARSFYVNIIIIVVFGCFASIILAIILSKGLSSSIMALKSTVQAVYEGDLNARYFSERHDEVAYLGEKFNEMLDEINIFIGKQKEQENTNKIMELKLMQSQINPHLLYNTLDSTLWALDNKNVQQAKELIVSLSEFFKITLSGGNSLIPIQKELELIRNYINIQKVARGKNINLIVKSSIPHFDFNIIKLSIQPFVENAILHGFSGFRDDGTIIITIEPQYENSIKISIEDNGIGISEEDLMEINKVLNSFPLETHLKHYGLYNVQRRIKYMYGDGYGISLESEVGNYTRVTMSIPFQRGDL